MILANELAQFIIDHPYWFSLICAVILILAWAMGEVTAKTYETEYKDERDRRRVAESMNTEYKNTLVNSVPVSRSLPVGVKDKLERVLKRTYDTYYTGHSSSEYATEFVSVFEEQLDQLLAWVAPKQRSAIIAEASDEINYAKRLHQEGLLLEEELNRIIACQREKIKDIVMGDCI